MARFDRLLLRPTHLALVEALQEATQAGDPNGDLLDLDHDRCSWCPVARVGGEVKRDGPARHPHVDRLIAFAFLPVEVETEIVDVEARRRVDVVHAENWDRWPHAVVVHALDPNKFPSKVLCTLLGLGQSPEIEVRRRRGAGGRFHDVDVAHARKGRRTQLEEGVAPPRRGGALPSTARGRTAPGTRPTSDS